MRLAQWVDGESVGWCIIHSEVSTYSNGVRAAWPHPLHSEDPSDTFLRSNSTDENVGLPNCWVGSCCNEDLEQGNWKEGSKTPSIIAGLRGPKYLMCGDTLSKAHYECMQHFASLVCNAD